MLLRCGLWGVGSSGENPGQSLKRPWPASVFYSWVASLAMPFREWKVSWNGESEDDLVAPAPSLSHNIYTLQNALLLNFFLNRCSGSEMKRKPTVIPQQCNFFFAITCPWFPDAFAIFFRFALHAMSLQFTDPKSCRIFRRDESVRTIHLLLRSRESLKEWRVVFQASDRSQEMVGT